MLKKILLVSSLLIMSSFAWAGSSEDCGLEAKSCAKYGAQVFVERCALCHGYDGLGKGILPISIKGYPDTNLLQSKFKDSSHSAKDIIIYGSGLDGVSSEMPPWGDELTLTQLESVVFFVTLMREDLEKALPLIKTASAEVKPSKRIGRFVFKGRCSLCHGDQGLGDGKMASIIIDPPPFDLTLSEASDEDLSDIIHFGGESMLRSPRMPPFGEDLSETEIASVILYIKSLRINN